MAEIKYCCFAQSTAQLCSNSYWDLTDTALSNISLSKVFIKAKLSNWHAHLNLMWKVLFKVVHSVLSTTSPANCTRACPEKEINSVVNNAAARAGGRLTFIW